MRSSLRPSREVFASVPQLVDHGPHAPRARCVRCRPITKVFGAASELRRSILAAGQPSSCRPPTDRGCKGPFKEPPLTAELGGPAGAALLVMRERIVEPEVRIHSPPPKSQRTFGP